MNQSDMEHSLRALLSERAEGAQFADDLADKIILQATSGTPVRRPAPTVLRTAKRRSWPMPLLAAAAVAAVLAGTVGYLTNSGTSGGQGHARIAINHTHSPAPVPTQSTTSTSTPPPPAADYVSLDSTLDNGARLVHVSAFKAIDLTFVGSDIWAMGSATCFATGTGRCSLLVHSSDGVHWSMLKPTPFNVADDTAGCSQYCVDHIRFATSKIGYLYGKSTLLMTTDAGRTWQSEPGGADALETLDGNVIRVSSSAGCPPGCPYTVQVAPVGSTDWQTVPLHGAYIGDAVTLARTGSWAYLMTYGNPAGGANDERSTLFVSDNDGATWTDRGEVCAQNPGPQGEVDASGMTGGSDGSIEVLCQPRLHNGTDSAWVTVSTNGGQTFRRTAGLLDATYPGVVGAATAKAFCVQGLKQLSCTRDGGTTYTAADADGKGPKHAIWLGFENQTDGRALEITGAGTTLSSNLWTTRDGGASWTLSVGIG